MTVSARKTHNPPPLIPYPPLPLSKKNKQTNKQKQTKQNFRGIGETSYGEYCFKHSKSSILPYFYAIFSFYAATTSCKKSENRMLRFVRELKNLTSTHVRLKNFKTTPLIFYNTILHIFHLPL